MKRWGGSRVKGAVAGSIYGLLVPGLCSWLCNWLCSWLCSWLFHRLCSWLCSWLYAFYTRQIAGEYTVPCGMFSMFSPELLVVRFSSVFIDAECLAVSEGSLIAARARSALSHDRFVNTKHILSAVWLVLFFSS